MSFERMLLSLRSFEFEVSEDIQPRADVNYNYAADVATLESLWRERPELFDNKGYKERRTMRDERLKMIRENHRASLVK
jgi:hypothetical protein